jgi:hypothetical protein
MSENSSEPDLSGITDLANINEKPVTTFDPDCVRKRSNWSTMKNEFKMDDPDFNPELFLKDMPEFSPKLAALLKKIESLDARDEKKYGRKFKHFIFSDIKSGGQGAKMLASGLISSGWTLGYTSELKNKAMSVAEGSVAEGSVAERSVAERSVAERTIAEGSVADSVTEGSEAKTLKEGGEKAKWGPLELLSKRELSKAPSFFLLSSVAVFDKPISVRMKKEILATFNSRPENIYGELARIIVMDSGFKEGIDLFDIKYVHIFEPSMNAADQKQVIGRGTRTCGQKGLEFHPIRGWPLEVFIYDLEIPEKLRFSLLGADTAQDLLMRAMNADIRIANFGYDIERLAVLGSVDFELNKAVHNFQVDLEDEDADEIVLGGDSSTASSTSSSIALKSASAIESQPSFTPFGHNDMVEYINKFFKEYEWKDVKMENLCGERPKEWIDYTPVTDLNSNLHRYKTKEESAVSELSASSASSAKESAKSESAKSASAKSESAKSASAKSESAKSTSAKSVSVKSASVKSVSEEESEITKTLLDSMKSAKSAKSEKTLLDETKFPKSEVLSSISTSSSKGGASSILSFTPTQDFVRHYFSPMAPVKGMLLYHSVGTGKTCSAIAAATTNFEPLGYTILWVTRTTLKNDIWKNMFDQVCHASIRERIANGESIPDVQKERMRLLSKAWRIRPMSYKQFSNLVSKKNQFYQQLVKENGEADPLHKTLLIIDEAHKLYGGGDLSSLERPDMAALHEALMNSYAVSGFNSVRVLLMTATPITENPMELVQLINLCKPITNQMPATFAGFSGEYLTEEGTFTDMGRARFLDDIAGYISYLNREKDARQFSQPRVKKVMVPMMSEEQMKYVDDFDKFVSRSQSEEASLVLQEKLENIVKKIEEELKTVSKTHFQRFQKKCADFPGLPETKCQAVIKKNITALMREVAGYTKNIREQMKVVRTELSRIKKGNQAKLATIKRKIEENPLLYSQYKSSTYSALREKCGSKTQGGFLEAVRLLPEVEEIEREIQASRDNIKGMETQLGMEMKSAILSIKQMKEALKRRDIAPVEKTAIEMSIRTAQTDLRKTKKLRKMDFQEQVEGEKEKIKELEKEKKTFFKRVRKTLKKIEKTKKAEEKEAKKQAKALRKLETELPEEDIKDEEIKQMAIRREALIIHDLKDLQNQLKEKEKEAANKQKEREEKKAAKEEAKETARKQKTLKDREKKEAKERARLEKERAKQEAKTIKLREKELAKQQKSMNKTRKQKS